MINKASDQDVVSSLASALVHRLPEWYGDGAVLASRSVTIRVHPYSFFIGFPVKTSAGRQTLLAKIPRKPTLNTLTDALAAKGLQKIARDEYETSRVIRHAFEEENSPVCMYVEYLGFLEKWNALLMRQIKGRMLKEYLLNPSIALRIPKSLAQLQEYLISSTRWLSIFHHHVSGLQIVPFPVEDARTLMEEIFSKLQERSKGQVDIKPYRAVLEQALEGMCDLHVPFGFLHADFQYSNILVTPNGRVCVLDYALNYRGPIYFDLATLLIDPQTRGAQILTSGRLIASDFIQSCKQLILNTYFDGEPYLGNVLDFYCTLAILNKWSADEADFSSGWRKIVSPILSRMTRRYYAKLLLQFH